MANRRNISTPPEDDDVWAAAEAVAATLGVPLSRLIASALREYAPIRVHVAGQERETAGVGA